MKMKDKLEFFNKLVLNEADVKKQQTLKELDLEFNEACEKAKVDYLRRADEILRNEMNVAKQIKNKEIISATTESKKAVIDLRNQLIDELFQSVNERVTEFIESPEYEKYLLDEISNLSQKYSDFDIILVQRDMQFADKITKATGANVTACKELEYFIGGFKMILKNKRAIIDNSFLTRLESEHKNFNLIKIS